MEKKGSVVAVSVVLSGAIIGWNFYYFQEALSALVLFALVFLPLLALAFGLAMAEAARERGMAWVETRAKPLAGSARRLTRSGRQWLRHHRPAA
jgi:hypothetical protein